ncbi:hypothetical protein ACFW04_013692 [Cataglyphis niger]
MRVLFSAKRCSFRFFQQLIIMEEKYNTEKQKKIFGHIDFKENIKAGLYYVQKLQYYAFIMFKNKLYNIDKKQLELLLRSIAENSLTYYFVIDILLFETVLITVFIHKQIKFMNMPEIKLLLEKQLKIVAQYFYPHVSYSVVKTLLDDIIHTYYISCKTESRQIMCVLKKYIFSKLEIHKFYQLLMILDLEAKYIKYIVGCFRRYLLTATCHIVARRLGIYSVLTIINEVNIAIVWKPKHFDEVGGEIQDTAKAFRSYKSQSMYPIHARRGKRRPNVLQGGCDCRMCVATMAIIQKMITFFYQKLLNNYNLYYKWNFNIFFNFLYRCSLKDIKNINIENEFKNITNTIKIKYNAVQKQIKRRPKKIKFAVGIIVTHRDYSSNAKIIHNGVIIGWHPTCNKKFLHRLKKSNMFPYLCFSKFVGTHYVPNKSLTERYPNDVAAIDKILAKQ